MFTTNSEINSDFMLDTLSFSQNMQKAGMSKEIADMLVLNLKNVQINQIENLIIKQNIIFLVVLAQRQLTPLQFLRKSLEALGL